MVSTPPYSQAWDSAHKESDLRYSRFGLAPKTKANFAFLLHDLYHLNPDGIMTVVLPHGVLFLGGDVPFDITGYLTEIDTGKIDADYMNSCFDKFLKELDKD